MSVRNLDILNFQWYLIDLDGTIWRDNKAIQGALNAIKTLKALEKQIIFVSNNCNFTIKDFQEKFKRLLNLDIPSKELITSGDSTAIYLKNNMDVKTEKVYLITSSEGLKATLSGYGIPTFGVGPSENIPLSEWPNFCVDKTVKFCVVDYDEFFCQTKLAKAYLYITENDAEFIAPDSIEFLQVSPTLKVPGALPSQAALSSVLGKKPKIFGKPDTILFNMIEQDHEIIIDRSQTVMIGDTYDTDMEFGFNCGISTALVLTGNTKPQDVPKLKRRPDFIFNGIGDIVLKS